MSARCDVQNSTYVSSDVDRPGATRVRVCARAFDGARSGERIRREEGKFRHGMAPRPGRWARGARRGRRSRGAGRRAGALGLDRTTNNLQKPTARLQGQALVPVAPMA